jgi:hypothetical protein
MALQKYAVMIMPPTIRANYPRINTESLAIVNIRLDTIPSAGDPFHAVVNQLAGYFTRPLENRELLHVDIPLNIDPDKSKSLDAHQKILQEFVTHIRRYIPLAYGFQSILIIIYIWQPWCSEASCLFTHPFQP